MKVKIEEGQIGFFAIPEESIKDNFNITDKEIDEILLSRHKKDIYKHFTTEPFNNELFVKEIYDTEWIHGYALNGYPLSNIDISSKGIRIEKEEGSKRAEINLNWTQITSKIEKLIKSNKYLTREEKIKFNLIDKKSIKNTNKEDSNKAKGNIKEEHVLKNLYDSVIDKYKNDCRFIVKGSKGIMIHLKSKAIFYDFEGNLKSELNSSFIPHKALGAILVDNIGYEKMLESTVLDNKVTKVANKSIEMDIKLTKGQAVKVTSKGKERVGKVHSIYNDGYTINVYFKDTNSVQPWFKDYVKAC